MTFNLKKKPSPNCEVWDIDGNLLNHYTRDEVDDWFEGFEKQEQDKQEFSLKQLKDQIVFPMCAQEYSKKLSKIERYYFWLGYFVRGKEFLG